MNDILHGHRIFISASLPSDHRSPKFTVDREHVGWIEDAVIATTRAVLENGGRLVLGGHPSIVPLVAMVAGEYTRRKLDPERSIYDDIRDDDAPGSSVPLVDVFQSRAFERYLPSETSAMCEAGLANIHWVESLNNEMFDPSKLGEPQCERSLRVMRETLLNSTKPTALVGMGGMEGLLEEFRMFSKMCCGPVYLFRSTGGMARIISNELQEPNTLDILPEGLAAQATLRPHYSLAEFDRKHSKRVHIVEFMVEFRDEVHRTKRDWVEEFIRFRDATFGRKEILRAAINPPYDYLASLLVENIAENI